MNRILNRYCKCIVLCQEKIKFVKKQFEQIQRRSYYRYDGLFIDHRSVVLGGLLFMQTTVVPKVNNVRPKHVSI